MTEQPSSPNGNDSMEKFLYEVAIQEQEFNRMAREQLDSKSGVILGFALVSIIEILGFLLLVAAEKNAFASIHWGFGWLFVGGLIILIAATALSVAELWPMAHYSVGIEYFKRKTMEGITTAKLRESSLADLPNWAGLNQRTLRRKGTLTILATIAAVVALTLFTLAVVVIFLALRK